MNERTENTRVKRIAGWVLSALLVAFLTFSAIGKFASYEGKADLFDHLGWSESVMNRVGGLEIAIALIFLFPKTAFLGAILLTAYLGGAVATHVRVGDPYYFPIIIGVMVWIALGLRDRRIFDLACCCREACSTANAQSLERQPR